MRNWFLLHRLSKCSVPAATWIAAQCVRKFARDRSIQDTRLDAYCEFLEELCVVEWADEWDEHGRSLEVSGMGDPLPAPLDGIADLAELIEEAREVASSQLYTRWQPKVAAAHLLRCMRLSGLKLGTDVSSAALDHDPGRNGWGDPVSPEELDRWRSSMR
jgi:hypothetical protein